MKIDMTMYGQKAGEQTEAAVPQPIYRLVQWAAQTMAVIMRTFGVAELKLELVPSGIVPVSTIKFQAMQEQGMPKELEDIRLELIRGVMLTLMERFGIGSIKLTLTQPEKAELSGYWEYLKTGQQAAPEAGDDSIFAKVPLPVETDPAPAAPPPKPAAKRRKKG